MKLRPSYLVWLAALSLTWGLAARAATGLAGDHPKAVSAGRVFDRLVAAVGDARTPPTLRLVPETRGGNLQIAWYSAQAHTVFLEERVYDLCVTQGADSLAALAVLLGHELAHFYGNHDWAGDFGNGFADLQVGRQMRDAHRQRGLQYETEADVFGGYYGYAAGFNTLGVAPKLLDDIYRTFALSDDLPGYPGLNERQGIARRSQEKLAELVPVFDAARHLLVIGEYEMAAAAFDWLARDFPSREILNNAGVAFALGALAAMPAGQVVYAMPFELDARTRLRQAHAGQRGQSGATESVQKLLEQARQHFDSARRRDPDYVPALVNLAAVDYLEGRLHAALGQVTEALSKATADDDGRSRAAALLVRGLCRVDSDSLRAAADFRAALIGAPELAQRNLEILSGDRGQQVMTAQPGVREPTVGPGSESHDAILAQPRVIELTGVQLREGGTPLILYRDLGDRHGYVVDTGERSLILLATAPGYAGVTARGITIGASSAALSELYGEPQRVISGVVATDMVYDDAGMVFRLDDTNHVVGWLRFHAVTEVIDEPQRVPGADFGPRVALVIGNDSYAEAPLRNAVNDAVAMTRTLRAAGFEVIQEVDADRRSMADAIRRFGERLSRRGGIGLFYYAGHGVQVGGANYLIPVGSNIGQANEVADESIAVDRILQKMASAGNDANILFLDACRNNPYAGSRSGGTGLAPLNAQGSFVAYATQPGKVAADAGTSEHGVFTGALLRHLLRPGQSITQLAYAVRKDVGEATAGAQFPLVENGLSAEFYFVPEGATAGDFGYAVASAGAATAPLADDMVEVPDFGFRIDRCEVTNAAFAGFLNDRGNRLEDGVLWLDEEDADVLIEVRDGTYAARTGFTDHPVIEVTWYGARAFCAWRGSVLPTAQQWEQAAWGPAGSNDAAIGNFQSNDGAGGTTPVGRFPAGAGPYGTLDMAGNVWEWVDDADGTRRLILGGSWYNAAIPRQRDWLDAAQPNEFTGFRCATPSVQSPSVISARDSH